MSFNVKIKILSDEMASRIAAGEVVERPASIVKELIENSLDAGADEIFVGLEKSGTVLVHVRDNGEGMSPADLALAVERHATSKLRDDDDLTRVATMGFRGEALPSIASVSRMSITSRPAEDDSGARLEIAGGVTREVVAAASSHGTTVEIRDIFYNTPARRKFLKSPATELSHVCDVVNRLALSQPKVHFQLKHDGRTVADYPAAAQPIDRVHQVLGRDLAKDLSPFSFSEGDTIVHGFLSSAPTSFPNGRFMFTFVNGRFVRDRVLTHAIVQGYDTLLMKGQYPAVILFLDLPFEEVDVNVHPAKHEVRFRHQSEVHEVTRRAVRAALRAEAREPSARPYVPYAEASSSVREMPFAYMPMPMRAEVPGRAEAPGFVVAAQAARPEDGFFSSLQIFGQLLGCYIVCASTKGLTLIDQHAAHERVAFEKLRRQMADGSVERQALLIPQTLDLTAGEAMLLEQQLSRLAQFGFEVEAFGPATYAVIAAPAMLPESNYAQVVKAMLAELTEVEQSNKIQQHLEERLATIACHSVIRANRALEMNEMRALLMELDRVDFATQCPHGRPVLLEFSEEELERMFKRVV